jgi:hypothetical protein
LLVSGGFRVVLVVVEATTAFRVGAKVINVGLRKLVAHNIIFLAQFGNVKSRAALIQGDKRERLAGGNVQAHTHAIAQGLSVGRLKPEE